MEKTHLKQSWNIRDFWLGRRNSLERRDRWAVFVGGILLGAICFIGVYGVQVLNPCIDNWIYTSASDFSQAYNGWLAYRATPWSFPLGYIDNLFYQTKSVTTISTDSIPIFALLFKLLSPLLPETFQYFGIWEIFCFCLQGGFGALLLRKKILYNLTAVFGSFFMVIASWFIFRVFGHCALSGQFIILAAWCLWAYERAETPLWRRILAWGGLCSTAILITPYFAIMTGGLMTGCTLRNLLRSRKWKELLMPVGSVAITAAAFALIGGFFGVNSGINNHLLGQCCLNLNAWYNPSGRSKFLPALSVADIYFPGEGFQYLGLGILLLLPFVLLELFLRAKRFAGLAQQQRRQVILQILPLLIVCAAFFFFSAFPNFYFGDKMLFSIPLPGRIYNLFDIFQSNGRFFWVISYGFTAFSILCYVRFWERFTWARRILPLLLIPVMILQWTERIDLDQVGAQIKQADTITQEQTILPKSGIWDEVFSQADYLDFLWGFDGVSTQALVPKAVKYGVKINMTQAARQSIDTVTHLAVDAFDSLQAGDVPDDKVYVLQDFQSTLPRLVTQEKLRIFHEDGYYLVVPRSYSIQGTYQEVTVSTAGFTDYASYLSGLDEDHLVFITSYHMAAQTGSEPFSTVLRLLGCNEIPASSGQELAGVLIPSAKKLAAFQTGASSASLSFDANSTLGDLQLPEAVSLNGKTEVYDDTNLTIGTTINGKNVLQTAIGAVNFCVYNVRTGVVESVAWSATDGSYIQNIASLDYSAR